MFDKQNKHNITILLIVIKDMYHVWSSRIMNVEKKKKKKRLIDVIILNKENVR